METMSTHEAVAWIIAAAKENARLYHDTLHSIVGVYNPGMRGGTDLHRRRTGRAAGRVQGFAAISDEGRPGA